MLNASVSVEAAGKEKRGSSHMREHLEVEVLPCGNQTLKELYKEILQKAILHI